MEELDLKELVNIFWSRKAYMIVIILMFITMGILYSYFFTTPKYKSYTTLVLTTSSDDSTTGSQEKITQTDISLNNNLVATYSELIKSKAILREVISNLNLNKTEDALKSSITVSAVKSTQLIQIDVIDDNPRTAKIVANEVAEVFASKVAELYNINNVHVVDAAEEPTTPYNLNYKKDILTFAIIGFVVAFAFAVVANMLDTTVKTKDDVERRVGLTVLVSVPTCNFDTAAKSMKKVRNKGGKRR